MKPVSYQSMPASVKVGPPSLAMNRVITSANVMYCDKCGFATTDPDAFNKHRIEHMGMKFHCFYCNDVSHSEEELTAHMKLHTAKYQFQCPHCGQGYMRRLCLVKHIERLHSKTITHGADKPGMAKTPQVSVSSALPSLPTCDAASLRPAVRVTVPKPSAPAARLDKDELRGKTLDKSTSNAINGKTEPLPPLSGLVQQSRALTVPLPEEVNIPAGCLVELVEVKTVNGTKELKLRLVSQQENESVIKDTRTVVSDNTALVKPLSSTGNQPTTAKSVSFGKCAVNRKPYETKSMNVEPPAVSVCKNLPNQLSRERNGLKRTPDEIIDLESNSVTPNKVPKISINCLREGDSRIKVLQREPAPVPTAPSTRAPIKLPNKMLSGNMGSNVSQRAADQPIILNTPQSKSNLQPRTSDLKSSPKNGPVPLKVEPWVRLNNSTNMKKEAVGLNQQNSKPELSSSCPRSVSALQLRPPIISVGTDNVAKLNFSELRAKTGPSLVKTPALSNGTCLNLPPRTQQVRLNDKNRERETPEPESFPVISSVFSLSQQPESVQGSIQPQVMAALRGIAMNINAGNKMQANKKRRSTNLMKEPPTMGNRALVSAKDASLTCDLLKTCESIKVEKSEKGVQPPLLFNHIHIKEEKYGTKLKDSDNQSQTPNLKPKTEEKGVSGMHMDACTSTDPPPLESKSDHDVSSKFLTVSLKRVQVGKWKKSKKGLKLRLSKCKTQGPIFSLTDYTVMYPMPLKEDQPVKRPGPYQPVVVLNHPKPRTSILVSRVDPLSNTGAFKVAPKCQILKMRLSKVTGRKYEVMGCTVGVFS
ncbi:zinc finger protein 518B [Cheilinus undulatus]|uniref:zinc finger protein 518B n=1 Tax=Cheilinus undulatus TaxID=241271 RepID=UPI001BD5FF19|nr:zinc finger protein 518B [Cheilinus undulatus]XP_041653728.1 zinc finger protein 518B [Cheilinus undulatus]